MTAKKARRNNRRITKARLAEMVEAATVDAYGELEQTTGWFTMIEENLAVPFETVVLGVPVTVERVELNASEQIVAICRRGRSRQGLSILDLPLDDTTSDGCGVDRGISPLARRRLMNMGTTATSSGSARSSRRATSVDDQARAQRAMKNSRKEVGRRARAEGDRVPRGAI